MAQGAFSSRINKGSYTRKTVDNALRYLDVLATTGNYSAAARAIDIATGTANAWRKDDGWVFTLEDETYTFRELCEQAMEMFADSIEQETVRRAVQGYDEPVVYKGQIMSEYDEDSGKYKPVTIKKYSDRLLEILLKGQRPKYAGDTQVNINAGDGAGVLVVPAGVDESSWSETIKEQQAPARAGQALGKDMPEEPGEAIDPLS